MNRRDTIIQEWLKDVAEGMSSMDRFHAGNRIKEKYGNLSDEELEKKLNRLEPDEIDKFL